MTTEDLLDLDNKIQSLEEEIKDNVEWLFTTDNDEVECIAIENLETILTKFFGRKISLSL